MSDLIGSIVNPEVPKDIINLQNLLKDLDITMVNSIKTAVQLNESILGKSSFKEYTTSAEKATIAIDGITAAQKRKIDTELKMQQLQDATALKMAQQALKEQQYADKKAASIDKAIANEKRLADAAEASAAKQSAASQKAAAEAERRANVQFTDSKPKDTGGLYETGPDTASVGGNGTAIPDAGASQNATAATIASIEADAEKVTSTASVTEAVAAETVALTEQEAALVANVELQQALRAELIEVQLAIKETDAATEAGSAAKAGLIKDELLLKQQLAQVSAEMAIQAREINAIAGSEEELSARLKKLQISYSQLTAAERDNIAVGGAMKTEIASIEAELNKGTGSATAFERALARATDGNRIAATVVSRLSRQVIGLGVGFLSFAIGAKALELVGGYLEELAEKYRVFALESKAAEQAGKAVADGIASSEYKTAIQNVSELTENIKLAKEGFLDKNKVVKEYNDTIGKTTGKVKDLNEAEQALNKNANAFIEFTLKKAVAQAALKDATDAQFKIAQIENKTDAKASGYLASGVVEDLKRLESLKVQYTKDGNKVMLENVQKSIDAENAIIKGASRSNKDEDEKDLKDQAANGLDIFKKYQADAAKIAKDNKFDFFQGTQDTKDVKKPDDKQINSQIETAKKLAEINKSIASDEKLGYDAREAGLTLFTKYEDQVTTLSAEKAKRDGVTKKNIATATAAANLKTATDTKALHDKIKSDDDKANDKRLKDGAAALEKAERAKIEIIKNSAIEQIAVINQTEQEALVSLAASYAKGEISTEEYNQKKFEITRDAANKTIQTQIDAAQKLVDFEKAHLIDSAAAEKELADLKLKYSKQVADQQIKDSETVAQAEQKVKDLRKNAADEIVNTITSMVTAAYKSQENAIKDQETAVDAQTKIQIDAENASLDSSQTKANKIAIINAKQTAQKALLADKEKKIEQDAAKFNKLINIGKAGEALAFAELQALTYLSNPLTAFAYPEIAALIGVIGAAQIADLIATPAYEKGGTVKRTGRILTGEKGRELRIDPDGAISLTKDRANFSYAQAGTKIISADETARILAAHEAKSFTGGQNIYQLNELVDVNKRILNKMSEPQKSIPNNNNNAGGWRSYVDRNIN